MSESEEQYVCHDCISEPYLSVEIEESGVDRECDFCGEIGSAIALPDLAEAVHEVLEAQFRQSRDEPDWKWHVEHDKDDWFSRHGQPVCELIAELLGAAEGIGEAIRLYLSDHYDTTSGKAACEQEQPYSEYAYYKANAVSTGNWSYTWETFKHEIGKRARFFNSTAETHLREIFHPLHDPSAHGFRELVIEVEPGNDFPIYRARVAHTDKQLINFLQDPVKELGPPPSSKVRPGRMNSTGIAVFYGATDTETCIAETRPPVGRQVAVARFQPIRSIRILDLDQLPAAIQYTSRFHPQYEHIESHRLFLKDLVEDLCRPVPPDDEARDYLYTQAVADYLSERVEPKLDGIFFSSSQSGGAGRNLVLFNHASGVEPYPTGYRIKAEIRTDRSSNIEEWDSIRVTSKIVLEQEAHNQSADNGMECVLPNSLLDAINRSQSHVYCEAGAEEETCCSAEPSIRLIEDSITVYRITAVSFGKNERPMYR